MSIDKFKKYYSEEKDILNNCIDDFNNNLVKEDIDIIRENLEYFKKLNMGGKLVRGTLVNLGYYLLKDNKDYSNYLSLAYEVFQTAILVHDDIIDNDSLRRGIETVHYASYNNYKKYCSNEVDLKNISDSIAICVGDYGLFQANQIVIDNYGIDKNLNRVLGYFNKTVLNTIRGEILDVVLPFNCKNIGIPSDILEKYIMNIYRLKTAYYTIIGPMVCGMLLAGATDDEIKDIEEYGLNIGIAFQIQDDILGIYSNEMGKTAGSDIKEFKATILYAYTMETEYKDELLLYYGDKDLTEEKIEIVQKIFEKSGALDFSTKMMNDMYDKSLEKLNNITWISDDKKELLSGFIEYLRTRKK